MLTKRSWSVRTETTSTTTSARKRVSRIVEHEGTLLIFSDEVEGEEGITAWQCQRHQRCQGEGRQGKVRGDARGIAVTRLRRWQGGAAIDEDEAACCTTQSRHWGIKEP